MTKNSKSIEKFDIKSFVEREEKSGNAVVSENRLFVSLVAVTLGTLFLLAPLGILFFGDVAWKDSSLSLIGITALFVIPLACYFVAVFEYVKMGSYFDVYTPQKMFRIRKNGKIEFDIEWSNVDRITYTKPSFLSLFNYGGPFLFLILTQNGYRDVGVLRGIKSLHNYYKPKDVEIIKKVIPVEIIYA